MLAPAADRSLLQRARETCELAGLGEQVRIDRDLMEWNCERYEAVTSQQIRIQRPDWLIFRDGCPEGESPEQVAAINRWNAPLVVAD